MLYDTHLPSPVVRRCGAIYIVRDDLLPGGTKRRVIPALFNAAEEYVYASPVQGHAQIALAHAAAAWGRRAVVFCAARRREHLNTRVVRALGAAVHTVRPGYLSCVRARARAYAETRGAVLLPFGLACDEAEAGLAALARGLGLVPEEVWCVAGSGTLARGLQRAWPGARCYAVRVGACPAAGRAEVLVAPERYEQGARLPPPFPSCSNYDAKAWRFIQDRASPGALFWNVAS